MNIKLKKYILILSMLAVFIPALIFSQETDYIVMKDGRSKIRLTFSGDEIAELKTEDTGFPGTLKRRYANSQLVKKSPEVRIFRVKNSGLRKSLAKGVIPPELKGKYLPVLRTITGSRRILKGGIIVVMAKEMSREDVKSWAGGNKLVILRQISAFGNIYLIKSPPGRESLHMAEKLGKDPSVRSATPDWWGEASLK